MISFPRNTYQHLSWVRFFTKKKKKAKPKKDQPYEEPLTKADIPLMEPDKIPPYFEATKINSSAKIFPKEIPATLNPNSPIKTMVADTKRLVSSSEVKPTVFLSNALKVLQIKYAPPHDSKPSVIMIMGVVSPDETDVKPVRVQARAEISPQNKGFPIIFL